jgi:hypothetical protein
MALSRQSRSCRWNLGPEPRCGGKRGALADTSALAVGLADPITALADPITALADPITSPPPVLTPIATWSTTPSASARTNGTSGPEANGSRAIGSKASVTGLRTRTSGNQRPVKKAGVSSSGSGSGTPKQKPARSASGPQSCQWCRQPLGPRNHSGRRRVYCSQSCRQRAYQSRKRSRQLGLKEGELLVSSVLLARMNKRLQALEAALREVEATDLQSMDERIAKLCTAARRLRRLVVGPPTR